MDPPMVSDALTSKGGSVPTLLAFQTSGSSRQTPAMGRRLHYLAFLVLIAAAGVWVGLSLAPAEPIYAGRPLSNWLDGGYEQASEAVHEIGAPAAPWIFAKLRREHPQAGTQQRYLSVWEQLPVPFQRILPRPKTAGYDEWNACQALVQIGPRVIPTLATRLRHRDVLVRRVSAQGLAAFRARGSSIGAALPALRSALKDRDSRVRREAAHALGAENESWALNGTQCAASDFAQGSTNLLLQNACRP
jgi:hypothetical protein